MFGDDLAEVASNKAEAMTFVTSQELKLAEREALRKAAGPVPVELYHLERITTILGSPAMVSVRSKIGRREKQYVETAQTMLEQAWRT